MYPQHEDVHGPDLTIGCTQYRVHPLASTPFRGIFQAFPRRQANRSEIGMQTA